MGLVFGLGGGAGSVTRVGESPTLRLRFVGERVARASPKKGFGCVRQTLCAILGRIRLPGLTCELGSRAFSAREALRVSGCAFRRSGCPTSWTSGKRDGRLFRNRLNLRPLSVYPPWPQTRSGSALARRSKAIRLATSAGIWASGIMFGPSEGARSGSSCVSMKTPAMPRLTAARAITGANSR